MMAGPASPASDIPVAPVSTRTDAPMTMKSVDLPHLRSVVLAGHAGAGKTTLAEQLLFRAGAIPRLGQGRRRDGPPRLRARGAEAPRVAEPGGRHVRTRRHADLARRHARLPGLRRRGHRGLRGGRRRDLRHGRLGRRRGRPGAGRRAGPGHGTAACFFINKCDRENADPTAALDALRAAFGNKIAPLQLAIGAAESFSGYVDLVHRKAYALGRPRRGRDPDPGRARRRGRPAPRPAARGRGRGRRRRPGEVPRGRGDLRRRARGVPAQGRQGIDPRAGAGRRPRPRASACAALLDAIVRYLPSPADEAPVDGHRQGRRRRSRSPPDAERAAARRACSRRPPTRSSGG